MILHCKCMLPKWVTVSVMGIPFMMCSRCGCGLPKPIVEKTMTHQEMHEVQKPKPKSKSWNEEVHDMLEAIYEEKYGNQK